MLFHEQFLTLTIATTGSYVVTVQHIKTGYIRTLGYIGSYTLHKGSVNNVSPLEC